MSLTELTIVTGASSNHFACLKNLLYSLSMFESGSRAIVYDLGLAAAEAAELSAAGHEIRKFDYDRYPPHVNLANNRGAYAWKPIIVAEALCEFGGWLLWLDSGNLIHARLDRVRGVLNATGFYCPTSCDRVRRWTHPGTLAALNVLEPAGKQTGPVRQLSRWLARLTDNRIGPGARLLRRPNRNAAMVGFNAAFPAARELAERWKAGALDKNCIAPAGATIQNHRFDQAVLTVLAYQFADRGGIRLEDQWLDISVHNDRLSLDEVRTRLTATYMKAA